MAPAHVIIFPIPAAGHVQAASALARKLASSCSFFVTFACAHHRLFDPRAGRKLVQLRHPHIRVLHLADNVSPLEYSQIDHGIDCMPIFKAILLRIREPLERTMAELMGSASPPVCLISDAVDYSREVAEKFGIPWYAFFPMPATELAFQLYVPHLHSQDLLPLHRPKSDDPEKESGAGLITGGSEHSIHVPCLPPWTARQCNNFCLGDDPQIWQRFLGHCREIHRARGILVNTFHELEAEAMDALQNPIVNPNALPIFPVGPLLSSHAISDADHPTSPPQTEDSEDNYCLRWLSGRPSSSVIYISFGSFVIPSVDQIRELACALESTKASFIWVVRRPRGSTGEETEAILPGGFEARTGERGMVVSAWVPQQRILAHPSIAGFLTHCGWNSTMESIFLGVPVIAMPHYYDQMTNCKMLVERLGMGVEARRGATGVVGREEVERVVGLLTDGEQGAKMRENARHWSEAAKRALGSNHGESTLPSSRSIEAFLKDLCNTLTNHQSLTNGL